MKHECVYFIKTSRDFRTGATVYEVWGRNVATGYEWLTAEYDTREEALMIIRHWQETK